MVDKIFTVKTDATDNDVIEVAESRPVSKTYRKEWLVSEIARLQEILAQFPKEIEKE